MFLMFNGLVVLLEALIDIIIMHPIMVQLCHIETNINHNGPIGLRIAIQMQIYRTFPMTLPCFKHDVYVIYKAM